MKALLYTRPRIDSFYHRLATEWLGADGYTSMSDHTGLEPIDIMRYFYQAQREQTVRFSNIPLNSVDYHLIATRCRYLRLVSFNSAVRHINAMWLAFERIYERVQPDVILGPVMDSYVLDVADRVARTRNHEYSGLLENMINGYCRLTNRGELRPHRTPSEDEVSSALAMLRQKTYVPKMQTDGMATLGSVHPLKTLLTKYVRDHVKMAYFSAKRVFDPCNFYYNTAVSVNVCTSLEHLRYAQFEDADWLQQVTAARAAHAQIVFLPLQFYPEASLDYWGTSLDFAQFERVVLRVLSGADPKHVVLMKEHPTMTALRNPDFYRQLAHLPNVILAPVNVPSNTLLDHADVVLTWTGSVGFEAAIRELPLVTFGKAYYDTNDAFLALDNPADLDKLPEICRRATIKFQQAGNARQPETLVREMLRGLLPGYVFTVDFTGERAVQGKAEVQKLATSIDAYFRTCGTGAHPVRPGSMDASALGLTEMVSRRAA